MGVGVAVARQRGVRPERPEDEGVQGRRLTSPPAPKQPEAAEWGA